MATYFRYDLWAKTAQGPALAGVQVWVCTQPTTNTTTTPPAPLASIYSDPLGASPITQPIQTDGFGHADFYALAGLYTVIISIGGVVQNVYADQNLGNGGLNVTITGTPVAGQALVATSSTTASWQTIAGTTLNYPAILNQFLNSYNAVTGMFTSAQPVLSGIGNPTSNVNFIFNANTFTRTYSIAQQWNESLVNSSLATATANYPTPAFAMMGSIYNGSTAVPDVWAFYSIIGPGTNPTSIFAFEHGGSTGIASVQVPNLLVLGNATFSGIIYDNNGHAGIAGQVLTSTSSGVVWAAGGGGGGAVTSVSNVDGTLTIAPTTGAVVAGLALGHANSWTVLQTFSSVHLIGTLADSTGAVGTSGQVLESTVSGTLWTTPPSFSNSFSALTSGTNTIAAMVVGSGATLGTSGTGTITANTLSATVTMPASTVFAPTSGSTLSITGPANTKLLDNTGDYILLSGGVTLADSSGFDSIELNSTSHAITFTSPNEFNFEGGGTIGLPNGSTAATQNPGDTSTLVATDAFVAAAITAAGHAFSGITSGTNTTAAMLVGSGATLSSSGTGTVTANTLASTVTVPATTTLVPASGSSIALYVTGSNSIGMGSSSGSNQIIFTNIGTTTLEASSQLLLDAPVINAQGQLNTYAVLMDGHVGALLVDVVGTVTISASTSASVTFTSAFGAAPCVVVTPTSDTTAVGAYWVTTSTTGFTVHVHTSGTVTFQYFVIGNGGV